MPASTCEAFTSHSTTSGASARSARSTAARRPGSAPARSPGVSSQRSDRPARFTSYQPAVWVVSSTAPTATAKDVTKNVTEGFGETTKALGTWAATHVGVHARVTVLVVSGALLRVRKHLVGLFGLFEFFFCLLSPIALVAVGVKLHRQLAISFLDVVLGRVFSNAQDFVVVALSHEVSL